MAQAQASPSMFHTESLTETCGDGDIARPLVPNEVAHCCLCWKGEWWDRIWYRYYEFSVDLKWNWIIIKNRCTEWKKNVGERWEDWHFAMSYHIRNFFGSSNTSSEAGTSYFLTFQGGGVIA